MHLNKGKILGFFALPCQYKYKNLIKIALQTQFSCVRKTLVQKHARISSFVLYQKMRRHSSTRPFDLSLLSDYHFLNYLILIKFLKLFETGELEQRFSLAYKKGQRWPTCFRMTKYVL